MSQEDNISEIEWHMRSIAGNVEKLVNENKYFTNMIASFLQKKSNNIWQPPKREEEEQ